MTTPATNGNEAEIRALMNDWTEAVRARDATRLIRHYAPDVVICDLTSTLYYTGAERYRQHMEGWFSHWQGPIGCERHDLLVAASEDVAFSTSLTHNTGTGPGGEALDFWVRVTVGFRKIDGAWKVVHEHVSVPFHMETMRAALDLKPETHQVH